jgi:hypothetical protein
MEILTLELSYLRLKIRSDTADTVGRNGHMNQALSTKPTKRYDGYDLPK